MEEEGQDGRRVRCGDHLPSHRYSRNTSTRGTAPTEHPLNAGRRRQTSQKRARRGDSERRLNELQRLARAAAISADPTATGVQREKRRDSRTQARRRAALTSPRGLSAHPPGRAGAGSWGSGFGASQEGVQEKVCSCRRGRDFFLPLCFAARRRGDSELRLNELQRWARAAANSADPRDGREPRRSAQTPETGRRH